MFSLSVQRVTNKRREAENSSRLLTVNNMTWITVGRLCETAL
jgi:hypothetical protein